MVDHTLLFIVFVFFNCLYFYIFIFYLFVSCYLVGLLSLSFYPFIFILLCLYRFLPSLSSFIFLSLPLFFVEKKRDTTHCCAARIFRFHWSHSSICEKRQTSVSWQIFGIKRPRGCSVPGCIDELTEMVSAKSASQKPPLNCAYVDYNPMKIYLCVAVCTRPQKARLQKETRWLNGELSLSLALR